jgi:4-hydroxybenzoate polyprenyltransferase
VLFSLAASAGYLINDIKDREYDRMHPRKKDRPIACGKIPVISAALFSVLLIIIVVAGSLYLDLTPFRLPPPATSIDGMRYGFLTTLAGYLVLTFFYSIYFKNVAIMDVLVLSGGFTLRAVAGAVALKVIISPWLLLCTGLLALFLVVGKRRQELMRLKTNECPADTGDEAGRPALSGYTIPMLDQFLIISASVNVMSYSLYTFSTSGHPDNRLMLTIPFVIYGIFRYYFLIHSRSEGEAPEEVLLKDRPLALCLILWVISVAILFMLPGFKQSV